ncbi:hypothetical protein IscW_ISCW019318 [Ixodes scapularis]|uniref:Uncharacterized protein n=1 Tax=Ixodes scapularis TaxID=6945 RepID=B7PTA7_IXOSC|nr:hypothetical protein IscW_ISCW019318 [Ixodes scapularis]|eukprot:XP_002404096.1 hypothetical protein IscW_ISCW019318 [Ixodes scapularis]
MDPRSRSRRPETSSPKSGAGGRSRRQTRRHRPPLSSSAGWSAAGQVTGCQPAPGYPPTPVLVLPNCSLPPPPGYPCTAKLPGYLVQGHTVFVPNTSPALVKPHSCASGYSKNAGQRGYYREEDPARGSSTLGTKRRTKKLKREVCQRLGDGRYLCRKRNGLCPQVWIPAACKTDKTSHGTAARMLGRGYSSTRFV